MNKLDDIFYRQGYEDQWHDIEGKLKQISVGPLGTFGVNQAAQIYYRTGTNEDNSGSGSARFLATAVKFLVPGFFSC